MANSKHNGCHREFFADVRLFGTNFVVSHGRAWPWENSKFEKSPLSHSSILFEAFWGTSVDDDFF
jgi:hypothetical protein